MTPARSIDRRRVALERRLAVLKALWSAGDRDAAEDWEITRAKLERLQERRTA
jgi:hypothetical protein